jgi:acetyltransferase-like isoleucine patch superfamily enzyme
MSFYLTVSQLLAFIPSVFGMLLRRAWYKMTLASCGRGLVTDWMSCIKTPKARLGNNCYIGVFSWVGEAEIGNDVMISGYCVLLSGSNHHGTKLGTPMRLQKGEPHEIKIGSDVWVGAGSVIMTDVSTGTVIGANSTVTKTFPEYSIIVGSPAKVLKTRE